MARPGWMSPSSSTANSSPPRRATRSPGRTASLSRPAAGQIAKLRGARVVGIAGGSQKCALLTDQLHFDAAVDHRAADWRHQLEKATPDGIDVDFENVGGEIMDAVFGRLNLRARVVLCG